MSGVVASTAGPFSTAEVTASLFPASARIRLLPLRAGYEAEWSPEGEAVPTPGPRRAEFLAGRAAAHAALRDLGADTGPILRGARGEPLWPQGVVGSISHGGAWCGAAVAGADDASAVGLDIESLEPPLEPGVERLVLSPEEREHYGSSVHALGRYATKIAFCAKECVLKAVYPATGVLVEPIHVGVEVDLESSRYRAVVDGRPFGRGGLHLKGRFTVAAGHLVTSLWAGAPPRPWQ